MDKEKEIVLLTDILCEKCNRTDLAGTNSKCCPNAKCHTWNIAEKVISEGYGNVKQAQVEILEKLKEKLTNFADGNNEDEVLSKIEACIDMENCIDELITELYDKGET